MEGGAEGGAEGGGGGIIGGGGEAGGGAGGGGDGGGGEGAGRTMMLVVGMAGAPPAGVTMEMLPRKGAVYASLVLVRLLGGANMPLSVCATADAWPSSIVNETCTPIVEAEAVVPVAVTLPVVLAAVWRARRRSIIRSASKS